MRRALVHARKALGHTQPNPMVGAIVLDAQGHFVSSGYHAKAGSSHAEALALQKAGQKAKGGTLYVTLEPCTHQGRTPPCTDQILKSEIKRVVMASNDPNPHVQGGGEQLLKCDGVEVVSGCLNEHALALNEPYFHFVKTNRPLVTAKIALSKDGRMGAKGTRIPLSGPSCLERTMRLRAEAGALLVGVNTVLSDDPLLTTRANRYNHQPLRGVIDPDLKTPSTARMFQRGGSPVTLFCRKTSMSLDKAKELERAGAQLSFLPETPDRGLDLQRLFNDFGQIGVSSVLVEGGPSLITRLANDQLIDRWVMYLTPKTLGPTIQGLSTLPNPPWLFDPPKNVGEFKAGAKVAFGHFRLHIRSVIRRGDDWQVMATP